MLKTVSDINEKIKEGNGYQRYNAAANSGKKILSTYRGCTRNCLSDGPIVRKGGGGPMAATYAIVDNGGDIALTLTQAVVVGIFTGPAKIKGIGLKFQPRPGIIGVCTSSGTVGHSLSFGLADAAMVIAGDVSLADAAATALGNAIKDKNPGLIEGSMRRLMIDEIEGMIVVVDDIFGVCGNLPEIVKVQMDTEKICKG